MLCSIKRVASLHAERHQSLWSEATLLYGAQAKSASLWSGVTFYRAQRLSIWSEATLHWRRSRYAYLATCQGQEGRMDEGWREHSQTNINREVMQFLKLAQQSTKNNPQIHETSTQKSTKINKTGAEIEPRVARNQHQRPGSRFVCYPLSRHPGAQNRPKGVKNYMCMYIYIYIYTYTKIIHFSIAPCRFPNHSNIDPKMYKTRLQKRVERKKHEKCEN